MTPRAREHAKTVGIIVAILVIVLLLGALITVFHGAHSGG